MMYETPILNIIGQSLLFIAKLAMIIASIIALNKKRNTAALLMLIGSISVVFADILGILLISYAGSIGVKEVVKYNGINSIIHALTYIIFATGFLLHVLTIQKNKL